MQFPFKTFVVAIKLQFTNKMTNQIWAYKPL